MKDPHEKDGGSASAIQRKRQAISDLQEQLIAIRRAIVVANSSNKITIGRQTRTIADWLTWRRDIAPGLRGFLQSLSASINRHRADALRQGQKLASEREAGPADIAVNLNEQQLAAELEELEAMLGMMDGQLSLKNATITVTYSSVGEPPSTAKMGQANGFLPGE